MEQVVPAPTDQKLVDEIRNGVSAAEAALYEKYSPRVFYLALSEMRSRENAEDVRAETFLRVLQAIRAERLRSPEALASFILNTARNVIREQLRHERRTEQIETDEIENAGKYAEEPTFLDADVKSAIEKVVRRLKPREQAFLRMYYYEEKSKAEIARELGIKEERLRLIKSRALKSFREHYDRLTKTGDTN
jgi:RNA polymerase sigma factor (sigma-70 family)